MALLIIVAEIVLEASIAALVAYLIEKGINRLKNVEEEEKKDEDNEIKKN